MTNTLSPRPKKLLCRSTPTTLPDDLIEENILRRLEVKPLVRLMGVSKGWSSMISGDKFTKDHLELWYPSNDRTFIVQEDRDHEDEDKFYLSLDENHNVNEFVELRNKYPTYLFKPITTCVVGSCNGLLCMLNEETMRIYVWNPMTNVVRDTMGPVPYFRRSEDYEVRCAGFGYVSSLDEYKIGCLMFYKKTLFSAVFSLKNKRWTKRPQEKKYYDRVLRFLDGETPVFVDDTIYWISNVIEDGESIIFGLDLVEDDLINIKIFLDIPRGYGTAKLFQMQGCLAICVIENDEGDRTKALHVHRLAKYGDEEDKFVWQSVLDLNYLGKNFVYLFDTGKFLVNKISHQSQRLMLHELKEASSEQEEEGVEAEGEGEGEAVAAVEEEEQVAEGEGEEEEEDDDEDEDEEEEVQVLGPVDEGTVVWESFDRGSFFRYFTGAAFVYSESLISPFYKGLLKKAEDDEDQIVDVTD